MSDLIKKALGLFVEFDEEEKKDEPTQQQHRMAPESTNSAPVMPANTPHYDTPAQQQDTEKFRKHFNEVFERANLAKPDYFDFVKMMEMLEAPIPDEKTRLVSVFATLSLQGLSKEKVLNSASQYMLVLEQDKAQFEKAAAEKVNADIEDRKLRSTGLERKIADNAEIIKRLTKEITDSQVMIDQLKQEIVQINDKITAGKNSYSGAYQSMRNKINSDIQKINTIIK